MSEIVSKNRTDDFDQYSAQYALEFVDLSSEVVDSLILIADKLLVDNDLSSRLRDKYGIYTPQQIELVVPGQVLSRPLSDVEKQEVNEGETDKVASISLTMQNNLLAVPVVEGFERMVSLESLFSEHNIPVGFSNSTFHEACGDWAGKERQFWVRKSFAGRLLLMATILKDVGIELFFEDAFRPLGVQEGLFKRRVGWTQSDHPDWDIDRVLTEARSKTAVTPRLASHKGGAAVDLRLKSSSGLLDIGHDYPDGGALVYLDSPFLTEEQWENRNLLRLATHVVGISMYIGEDWHLSFGDNLASLDDDLKPKPEYLAKYGPIKDFNRISGVILETYTQEELDTTFEI